MTYNVFGGTLNLAQSVNRSMQILLAIYELRLRMFVGENGCLIRKFVAQTNETLCHCEVLRYDYMHCSVCGL